MKNILILVFVNLLITLPFSQNSTSKLYKSEIGNFSFTYPTYLEQQKINNAPHMLLKLNSDKFSLTISLWEYYFDESISIWDDDIVSNFLNADKSISNSQIEKSCEKMYLNIDNKVKVKCLKSIITTNYSQGQTIIVKQITYRFLNNGNYLQFCFFVLDDQIYWNNQLFFDDIMKGLKLL